MVITADSASWDTTRQSWRVRQGASRVIASPAKQATFTFRTLRLRALTQSPADLLAEPKAPDEMRYGELGRYIDALKRSGNDANKLIVERALKLALPATCLIIALFGAPLATSNQRGGAAYGIGVSLGITIAFLVLIQLTKAIGGSGGLATPELAAWVPNALFGVGGLILLWRVRT